MFTSQMNFFPARNGRRNAYWWRSRTSACRPRSNCSTRGTTTFEPSKPSPRRRSIPPSLLKREFFVDNLLVRIHFIIERIRWTGLAPWEFDPPSKQECFDECTFPWGDNIDDCVEQPACTKEQVMSSPPPSLSHTHTHTSLSHSLTNSHTRAHTHPNSLGREHRLVRRPARLHQGAGCEPLSLSLSASLSLCLSLSLSLSHTPTHTCAHSLSLTHTHFECV